MTSKYSTVCITKNIVFIKENIASVDRVLDILLENDVIQMTEREDIVSKIPGERVHTMIDMVLKRRAQQTFIDALRKTGQNIIVDRILSTQKDVSGQIREPKPHTISLLSPKIAAYAPMHRERTTTWQQQKEQLNDRRSHDEANKRYIENLLETKRQNEAKIKHLENEMERVRKSEKKKYKQLEKEHKELTKENNDLKAKVEDLTNKLAARDTMTKASTSNIGQDEVDSPVKRTENDFLELKKSQENFENRLMKEMAKGQQQLLKVVEALTQKNDVQEKKIAEATAKLDTATAKLDAVYQRLDSRLEAKENRKSTGKSSLRSSDSMLPPLSESNKLGKTISASMARQESFIFDVGIPPKK